MRHIVLLGDSIFDNAAYVPGEDAVVDQIRNLAPDTWTVTLLARDGDVTADVRSQLTDLPRDATDLMVSVGGNDALGQASLLENAQSIVDIPPLVAEIIPAFRREYRYMLDKLLTCGLSTAVCTVYDQCPFPDPDWRELVPAALQSFNACIQAEANARNVPVIDLRELCTEREDFSALSPIEPSSQGGNKIAAAIVQLLQGRA